MKTNIVKVTLWGNTVGYLHWDDTFCKTTTSIFQFDPAFLDLGWNISPLRLSTNSPLAKRGLDIRGGDPRGVFKGLPSVFADSLPDHWGNAIFKAWAGEHGIRMKDTSPVDMLSFIGKRGMGALEYLPAMFREEDEPFDVDVLKLYDFAKSVLEERELPVFSADKELLWQDLLKLGTSPGGKRPKALIAINEKLNSIKSGQAPLPPGYEYYILKYDNEKDSFPYARMEYAYYLMSKDAGIEIAQSQLKRFDNATHFLTKRFDRNGSEKLHMQSLLAMRGETDSYEEAFDTISKLNLNYKDREQLFRRMVFNVVSGNIDDHARNFSFLMDRNGKWSLSPAYDMVFSIDPVTLYTQKGQFMSINGKKQGITFSDLVETGRRNDINRPEGIIENILDVVGRMESYLKPLDIPERTFKMIATELNEKYGELECGKPFLLNPSGYSLPL